MSTATAPHVRNGAIILVGQWTRYAIQIASIVVLARLLPPADFGVYAIVAVFAGIVLILSDFGLYLAAVRAPVLTPQQKSNLFWLNVALGLALWLALVLGSIAVARFYDLPRLVPLLSAAGSAVAFAGCAVQLRAELARSERFRPLAAMDALSQLVGLVVAVVLALAGAGVWALVAQLVGVQLTILVVSAIAARWVPRRPVRTAGMRELVSFGSKTLGTQVLNYASSNVDNLAIGYVWGPAVVGVYSRNYQLAAIPIQQLATPLSRVAIPALARTTDEAEFRAAIRGVQLFFCSTIVGVALLLAAAPTAVLEVVLGDQWTSGAVYLRILAIAGAVQAVAYVHYWIFAARNRMGLLLLLEGIGRFVMVGLILALVPLGAEFVAYALLAGQVGLWLIVGIGGLARVGIPFAALLATSLRPVALWTAACVVGAVTEPALFAAGVPAVVVLGAVLAEFAALALLAGCLPGYRSDARELIAHVRSARRVRRPRATSAAGAG